MGGFLRKSTNSQDRAMGPFVDDVDFKTPETALTIAASDIQLVANGGEARSKESGGGTHRINGVYRVIFSALDTADVGELEVSISVAGALIVFDKFTVVEAVVYDALFAVDAMGFDTTITTVSNISNMVTNITNKLPSELVNGRMKAILRKKCD